MTLNLNWQIHAEKAQEHLEYLIMATPTGQPRNLLTEAKVSIMLAIEILNSEEGEKK